MNYAEIKKTDIANGVGVRVSLFVSGCTHRCPGCFNKETWNPTYGKPFTKETFNEIIEALKPSYIDGLTLLGGDPLDYDNPKELLELARYTKVELHKSVWLYTGDYLENIMMFTHTKDKMNLLRFVDILVDGPFIEKLSNPSLKFKGSLNQRIVDMDKVREQFLLMNKLNFPGYRGISNVISERINTKCLWEG